MWAEKALTRLWMDSSRHLYAISSKLSFLGSNKAVFSETKILHSRSMNYAQHIKLNLFEKSFTTLHEIQT